MHVIAAASWGKWNENLDIPKGKVIAAESTDDIPCSGVPQNGGSIKEKEGESI